MCGEGGEVKGREVRTEWRRKGKLRDHFLPWGFAVANMKRAFDV